MVEVIAHEFEPALGDAHEPAGIVAGELVAHLLVILEALVGLVEDFLKHILLAQPVIVIDQLFDQILGGELRLLDDHVAAGHPAEAAPVAGALVDDEHVLHMLPGRQHEPEKPPPMISTSVSKTKGFALMASPRNGFQGYAGAVP